MDHDNIVVANESPPLKSVPKTAEKRPNGPSICGAMSQQRGDLSNRSVPQKFLHLVGCRDLRAQAPTKR